MAGAIAVVCVLVDDLHTLETALLARELRADVRVVVQIRNPAVGRALTRAGVAVLDVAGLSAPSVVEACLRTGVHRVDLDDERFVVATVTVGPDRPDRPGDDRLRTRFGDLAPVAVTPAGGGDVVVCPGRDHPVRPGDRVALLGTPAQLREAGLAREIGLARDGTLLDHLGTHRDTEGAGRERRHRGNGGAVDGPSPRRRSVRQVRAAVAAVTHVIDQRVAFVLAVLVTLVAVSASVLRIGYAEPAGRSHVHCGRGVLHRGDDRHHRVRRLPASATSRPGCGCSGSR